MSSPETLKERVVDDFGNIRSDEQGYMNGADVFNFVIEEVPKDIKRLCSFAGEDLLSMDYYIFHQANAFINNHIVKKLRLDKDKVPMTIQKFGNTSSVSIPLTIVSELADKLDGVHRVMLSAFGVGMAWATAIIPLVDCRISNVVEL